MKTERGTEITIVLAIVVVLFGFGCWLAWPWLTGTEDPEPDGWRAQIRAWIWPKPAVEAGPNLYLDHPPQYIPPSPPYPLPRETKAIADAESDEDQALP